MANPGRRTRRIASVVAGTLVALACGTNYAYSAWAPQFADRMKLSSTESNLIGVAGNLGMYASGIPLGLLTDTRGPRVTTLLGAVTLAAGYYPIYRAYENGKDSLGVPFLCFFVFLTGFGGCSAFSASIKTAASNFPDHRGTATAFPLAAFGLSALFWSTISTLIFKDDTGRFLLLLALGTSSLNVVSTPLLRILPPSDSYIPILQPQSRSTEHEGQHHRARSSDTYPHVAASDEAGTHNTTAFQPSSLAHTKPQSSTQNLQLPPESLEQDEVSLLVSSDRGSRRSQCSLAGYDDNDDDLLSNVDLNSHRPDIRGLALLPRIEFWQLFLMMALLSGIGLMTINNIGSNAQALWSHYDDSTSPKFIQQRQVMHVSILSLGSCVGRLLSGIGSDLLVRRLNMSRFWCLLISAVVFTLTQLAGASISNPNKLVVVSAFTGIAYGFLFGVFPSLVAHAFGIGGLSQNWGVMTLAPVVSGNIYNLFYGKFYDGHSVIGPDGDRSCPDGLGCYRAAYYITFFSGIAGVMVSVWSILYEKRLHGPARKKTEHDRLA